MVKDGQVRMLMRRMNREKTLEAAAAKAGMTDKTARKYRRLGKLPSQCRVVHDWKTREDAFESDWPWAEELLRTNPGLEAKTLFEALQREQPGRYQDGQLRTFQRRVKRWRALDGPGKEIFFAQVYEPGEWCESDFTHMESLGVTIGGVPFPHLL
jgi:hypothetical protein